MQRFKYIPRTYTFEGEYGGYFDKADDGEYVLHSEAQARIEALESELTVERERRVAAEKVVDAISLIRSSPDAKLAAEYRTKFPKGDDHG